MTNLSITLPDEPDRLLLRVKWQWRSGYFDIIAIEVARRARAILAS